MLKIKAFKALLNLDIASSALNINSYTLKMENSKVAQFDNIFEYDSEMLENLMQKHNTRLSLAYGQLEEIPAEIVTQLANQIQFLDLSHNQFKNLAFLEKFTDLRTLILDRNLMLDCPTLPFLRNLDVLWLNNCNLINIEDWLRKLQVQCPNLRELSMMCNPVGHTRLNGVTDSEENAYRKHVSAILPQLIYFDGVAIEASQRRQMTESSSLSLAMLEDIFGPPLRNLKNLSTRMQRNFKSMEKLNTSLLLLRTMSFSAKHV